MPGTDGHRSEIRVPTGMSHTWFLQNLAPSRQDSGHTTPKARTSLAWHWQMPRTKASPRRHRREEHALQGMRGSYQIAYCSCPGSTGGIGCRPWPRTREGMAHTVTVRRLVSCPVGTHGSLIVWCR